MSDKVGNINRCYVNNLYNRIYYLKTLAVGSNKAEKNQEHYYNTSDLDCIGNLSLYQHKNQPSVLYKPNKLITIVFEKQTYSLW